MMLDDFLAMIPKEDKQRIDQQIDKLMEQENNKRTSIEWFAEKLASQALLVVDDYPNLMAYQQAKAMHKQQVISFAVKAVSKAVNEDINNPYNLDELYDETFGGQDNE